MSPGVSSMTLNVLSDMHVAGKCLTEILFSQLQESHFCFAGTFISLW